MFPLASASCLITDHRQYELRDYPPSILPSVGATLLPNRVNVVRTDLLGGEDAGPPLTLDVKVFDPNVDQRLRYKIFINHGVTYAGGAELEGTIEPSGEDGGARTPPLMAIPLTALRQDGHAHCNKIELWVSGDFTSGRTPALDGDVAEMTWFVLGTTASETDVSMGDCP